MTKTIKQSSLLLGFILLALSIVPTHAHSLKNLENRLNEKEKFFQSIDQVAPDFTLQDADGRTVSLADLRGKVVVLNFVYISCPDVCPMHAAAIAEIQEMINISPMRDLVQFVTVTTDPVNDSPDIMREYGTAHGLDPINWMFLTSGADRPEETRQLVERFGHKFTKRGDGYQVHGVVTHVIDMEGRWRANFHGLNFQPTNLVLFINALTNDVHKAKEIEERSLWERIKNMF